MLKTINKLEILVQSRLKSLPHLPVNAQKWLAVNIWWLALIGICLFFFSNLVLGSAILSFLDKNILDKNSSITIIILLLSIIGMLFIAMAIMPLKKLKRIGWQYLFVALLFNVLWAVVSAILSLSVIGFLTSIFSSLIGLFITTYLLFEIRSFFVSKK